MMKITKHLMKYSSVLTDAQKTSFWRTLMGRSSIKGRFQDYDAEMGVMPDQTCSRNVSYKIFFRVLLKKRFKLPFFMLGECPLSSYSRVSICDEQWLRTYQGVALPHILFYSGDIVKAIDDLGEACVRENFAMLVDTARKLENGEIDLSGVIAKTKKETVQLFAIIIPAGILVVAIMYWWFTHFS